MTIEPDSDREWLRVNDHPEPLGALLEPFDRRRISAAVDETGRIVLIRPDQVLVALGADDDGEAVIKRVAEVDSDLAEGLRTRTFVTDRLARVDLPPSRQPYDRRSPMRWSAAPVGEALAVLEAAEATAMPNYVVQGSQGIKGSPVGAEAHFVGGMMFTANTTETPNGVAVRTTADPSGPPTLLREPLGLGRAPRVLVADTGLCTTGAKPKASPPTAPTGAEHPELSKVSIQTGWVHDGTDPLSIDDEDEQDADGLGYLDFEAGHGTFIAGVVRQICPDAVIETCGVLSSFGDGDVAKLLLRLQAAIKGGGGFDLVVLSLGGYMSELDADLFGQELSTILGGALPIAAAGNQATSRRYYPAALPEVIGVGGLGEDGRAWFSNFGGWVDACAPAVDVVSTFFVDAKEPDGPHFQGWARWSGTSFAAPKVAAALAQEMVLTDCSAADAWRRLSDFQRLRVPDLGTVFNL